MFNDLNKKYLNYEKFRIKVILIPRNDMIIKKKNYIFFYNSITTSRNRVQSFYFFKGNQIILLKYKALYKNLKYIRSTELLNTITNGNGHNYIYWRNLG